MYNRRDFLRTFGVTAMATGFGMLPFDLLAQNDNFTKLTILHTNDVHSRIEPFPMDGGRYQGLGGAARRAAMIKKIRATEKEVLLLDSGDMFQGTPYFNFFGGELEFKLMSQMKYDAATIGNHDFDAGINGLLKQLPNATFPLINCNYDFSDTVMNGQVEPRMTIQKGPIKIGILGVGIELKGLVAAEMYKNTKYLSPIENANKQASILKNEENCDLVICLSHLGYHYKNEDKIDDIAFAKQTDNIDLIFGGHTHTFLEKPDIQRNKSGKPVQIHQVGWGGIMLGRLDVYFEKTTKKYCSDCKPLYVK
jgi:5'-nucleotidase